MQYSNESAVPNLGRHRLPSEQISPPDLSSSIATNEFLAAIMTQDYELPVQRQIEQSS